MSRYRFGISLAGPRRPTASNPATVRLKSGHFIQIRPVPGVGVLAGFDPSWLVSNFVVADFECSLYVLDTVVATGLFAGTEFA
jgi:hypothetical protein